MASGNDSGNVVEEMFSNMLDALCSQKGMSSDQKELFLEKHESENISKEEQLISCLASFGLNSKELREEADTIKTKHENYG